MTGTVPSIPLIVGSILSKKLAEGAGTLVFDVKCGSGAFMKTRADACALARALVDGAKAAGRKAAALVTAMDEPLGRTVGNALEVEEAIAVLKGAVVPSDVIDLSVELAARMVSLEKGVALDEARAACRANLANGAAYARFAEMVKLHGGDLAAFAVRPRGETRVVASPRAGYVARVDAEGIAQAAFELGAGRAKADDVIDFAAGVTLAVSRGDRVEAGQPLAELASSDHPERFAAAERLVRDAVTFADEPLAPRQLILENLS